MFLALNVLLQVHFIGQEEVLLYSKDAEQILEKYLKIL